MNCNRGGVKARVRECVVDGQKQIAYVFDIPPTLARNGLRLRHNIMLNENGEPVQEQNGEQDSGLGNPLREVSGNFPSPGGGYMDSGHRTPGGGGGRGNRFVERAPGHGNPYTDLGSSFPTGAAVGTGSYLPTYHPSGTDITGVAAASQANLMDGPSLSQNSPIAQASTTSVSNTEVLVALAGADPIPSHTTLGGASQMNVAPSESMTSASQLAQSRRSSARRSSARQSNARRSTAGGIEYGEF